MPSSNEDSELEALLDGPAMAPPRGEVSDFVNNGAHHVLGYGVILVVSILTILAMVMRLYSRYAMKKFRIEDVCLIIAFVRTTILTFSCQWKAATNGYISRGFF